MGTLTLADFRDEVRLRCGGIPTTSSVWTDARIDRRINDAYLWCARPRVYRHPELETREYITLLVNTSGYTPTNTYYMIYGVAYVPSAVAVVWTDRRQKLDPIDQREMMDILRTSRKPTAYAYYQNQIVIDSVPDTASLGNQLEVYGYMQPDPMVLATDDTLIRPEWDEIIVKGAEYRQWEVMNEHDHAYEAKQSLGELVNSMDNIRMQNAEEWHWQTGSTTYPGVMGME